MIVYLDNTMSSQIGSRVVFDKVIDELRMEGRGLVSTTAVGYGNKIASFEDGTKVFMEKFGKTAHGMRLTHMYFDEGIMSLPKGEEVVKNAYLYAVVNGEYNNWDTEGERLFTYNHTGNTKTLKGE